jgi:hypothetical protein
MSVAGAARADEPRRPSYAFKNGRWFDGRTFAAKTFYSVGGRLQSRRPATVDREIDLAAGFVIPACGEAHNHNATSQNDKAIDDYLRSGILYVKNPTNLPRLRQHPRINTPTGIDVVFSNGGFTAPGGHPLALVARNQASGAMTQEDGDGGFYHTLASLADLEQKWPRFLASRPDFVKTTLVYSEELEKRRSDEKYFSRRGLDPALLAAVLERAHTAGLTVSTHVESAADFHAAVEAGADEINHMPGFWPSDEAIAAGDFERYRIREADARKAGARGIRVVTTIGESLRRMKTMSEATRGPLLDVYRGNLALLGRHGVPVLIGSDQFRETSLGEALALSDFGLMSNLQLVRAWCEVTPQAIFPGRRIGRLRDGFEANFAVLGEDPLASFAAVKNVRRLYKRGEAVGPAAAAAPAR